MNDSGTNYYDIYFDGKLHSSHTSVLDYNEEWGRLEETPEYRQGAELRGEVRYE